MHSLVSSYFVFDVFCILIVSSVTNALLVH